MKKIKLLSLTLFVSVLSFLSCTKSETKNEKNFTSSDELFKFSKVHSDGVAFCTEAFNKKFANSRESFTNKSGGLDTLAIIKFFEIQTKLYLTEHPVSYNNNSLGIEYLIPINDELKMAIVKNTYTSPFLLSQNELANSYYSSIKTIINESENSEEVNFELDKLFTKSQNELISEKDKLLLQLMIGVASDSYSYWSIHGNINPVTGKVSLGTALADIQGAWEWGVFGAAAGPLGAVLVGLNGAIIHSCVAHALG